MVYEKFMGGLIDGKIKGFEILGIYRWIDIALLYLFTSSILLFVDGPTMEDMARIKDSGQMANILHSMGSFEKRILDWKEYYFKSER